MSKRPRLMDRLDKAAEQLLDRYFTPPAFGEAPPDAAEQIKAFQAVTAYFGPRTKLGGTEDDGGSEFEKLRAGLNSRASSRRRNGPKANGSAAAGNDGDGDDSRRPN